ncbi:MAG: putative sulfate exporter family transporter [Gemmataceae bacterium]|nr:putative sulfate exporter family transporter [Gemmataceae bacterium]
MLEARKFNEDRSAVWLAFFLIGLTLFLLAGLGDCTGWVLGVKVWTDPGKALAPLAKSYAPVPGWLSLAATIGFLCLLLLWERWKSLEKPAEFFLPLVIVVTLTLAAWVIGHHGFFAATPNERNKLGLNWSLGLTGEAGYLLALGLGLILGNFFPKAAGFLAPAARTEWFIKTGIVLVGAAIGVKAMEQYQLAGAILLRGLAAIVEAYLIYWALVYLVARKCFGFSREWAAPLASGISICGVSAAIATGAAIRARPVVPIVVSSLVVVFSVVELLGLPFLAKLLIPQEPMVAAAWMGLAVKTDGAAIASGAITEALFNPDGVFKKDWMLLTTTTVKIFIDLFIGVWCLVLSCVWVYWIDKKPGDRVGWKEVADRFPRFVLAYFLAFGLFLLLTKLLPEKLSDLKIVSGELDAWRKIFFALAFFSIGLSADFRKLWQEGLGKLLAVYVVCLFGFVIWIGLGISWLFFHGMQPPLNVGGGP